MVDDQRFASYRPDVLVYESAPLEQDVTIAGPISPRLFVASSGTDSDFDVKLIDVYPEDAQAAPGGEQSKRILGEPPLLMGGYEQLLRGEPFRAKFRHSLENPEPLTPGKMTGIYFTMPDLFHTFRRGHRIMVQVQSSWFPLTDRNPQTFTDIPNAKPGDFRKATETVFHQKGATSGVEVMVLPNQ
jgi:putative CocE/NonD family hydrolase